MHWTSRLFSFPEKMSLSLDAEPVAISLAYSRVALGRTLAWMDPLECWNKRKSGIQTRAVWVQADLNSDLPLKDESADVVLITLVLEHFPKISGAKTGQAPWKAAAPRPSSPAKLAPTPFSASIFPV